MAVNTRFSTVRMEKKLSKALTAASSGWVQQFYEHDASEVAKVIHDRIVASGRGGEHNSDFANIEHRAFRAQSGRYNVMVGWLNPPEHAREKGTGGRLWYQYQDSGFQLFGGSQWIEGVGATIDRREMLLDRLEATNSMYVKHIADILNG